VANKDFQYRIHTQSKKQTRSTAKQLSDLSQRVLTAACNKCF